MEIEWELVQNTTYGASSYLRYDTIR